MATFGDGEPRLPHILDSVTVEGAERPIKPNETVLMLVVLGLIDVVMISNLLIMVIVGGYETFVSRMRPRRASRPAGVAVARQRLGAQGEARHRDHRHLVDPPAQDLHQRRGVRREDASSLRSASISRSCCRRWRSRRRIASCRRRAARLTSKSTYDDHPARAISSRASPTRCNSSPTTTRPTTSARSAAPTSASSRAAAKDAIAQILTNSRMCAEGHRPICQDTGIVNVFVKIGMNVRWDFARFAEDMINEGVRRAYTGPGQQAARLGARRSDFGRKNTKDNTPAVINVQMVPGDKRRGRRRREGRRLGGQGQVRDAQSVRLDRRLGGEDRADDGRGLVPAGHARHRRRRHRRKGDADGEGSADGADRHGRAQGARRRRTRSRSCASSSTTR